ncbi:MAG: DUF1573 domain-containing protein [Bacteroidetes bacterium]|nr:MAG: DUF1573 domain-containing protein [Bacteroidota bacterium]
MERSKQIQIGLLALLALLLIANLFGGGFKNWFGQSEGDQIRHSAAALTGTDANAGQRANAANTGNIPGTNVNVPSVPEGSLTSIKYDELAFDFGVVDEGTVVKHVYNFTNTGSEPLVISNAKGSCGCTVPTWPKQPVPPGGTGELVVEFNTKGKPGRQSKQVTVTANTNPTDTHIEIHGEVRGKDQPVTKGK